MKTMLTVQLILLTVVPLAGQPPTGAWESVDRDEQQRYSMIAGSGILAGAFLVSVACDGPDGQKDWGVCGRSTAGSAFNGGILGGLTGHVTHLLTVNRDHVAAPARPFLAQAAWTAPCPPEPEPCPPPRKGRWIERNRSAVFAGAGAVAGAIAGVAVCSATAPLPEEAECLYPAATGAALGAFAGYLAYMFIDGLFEGNVDYAVPVSVDVVTLRIPLGIGW